VDDTAKKVVCTGRCKTCAGCICVKSGEFCGDKCGCREECTNQPKPTAGFPPSGWSYEPLTDIDSRTLECPSNRDRNPPPKDGLLSPFELLKTFWTDELCDHFLKCIQQKAERKNLRRYPKTREDLWRYFIVLLAMGLVKFPRIKDYWRQDKADLFGSSYFGRILSGRKYHDFREAIDFDITYVEDYLNYIFKKNWVPSTILVVDECLILFKGRFGGRQHIRGKPHATGLKFYTLADSAGYCYGFWLYRGKDFPSKHSAKQSDIVTEFVASMQTPPDKPVAPNQNSEDLDALNDRFEADLRAAEELGAEVTDPLVDTEEEENEFIEESSIPVPFETFGEREFVVIADSYFGSLACARKLNAMKCYCLLAVRKNVDAELKNFLCKGLKKHK
jgi:hypothetical protein